MRLDLGGQMAYARLAEIRGEFHGTQLTSTPNLELTIRKHDEQDDQIDDRVLL